MYRSTTATLIPSVSLSPGVLDSWAYAGAHELPAPAANRGPRRWRCFPETCFSSVRSVAPISWANGHTQELAGELYETIHHRLAPIGDDVVVYPGHTAGSPAAGKSATRPTPRWTAAADATTRSGRRHARQFIESVLASMPPLADLLSRPEADQQGGAALRRFTGWCGPAGAPARFATPPGGRRPPPRYP